MFGEAEFVKMAERMNAIRKSMAEGKGVEGFPPTDRDNMAAMAAMAMESSAFMAFAILEVGEEDFLRAAREVYQYVERAHAGLVKAVAEAREKAGEEAPSNPNTN